MASRARILLVEDDSNERSVALRAFRRADLDAEVVAVGDGAEALEILGRSAGRPPEERPQVVFLDLRMPGMDGWDVLRELRTEGELRDLPVVVVSSSSSDADVRRSYRMGANSYIVKRYDSSRPGAYLVEAARYWLQLNQVADRPAAEVEE